MQFGRRSGASTPAAGVSRALSTGRGAPVASPDAFAPAGCAPPAPHSPPARRGLLSLNPAATISQSNLACADILMMNEARLEPFLKAMPFPRLTHEHIVRGLWEQLRNASPSQMGSLLRLEQRATQLLLQEQGFYQRPG